MRRIEGRKVPNEPGRKVPKMKQKKWTKLCKMCGSKFKSRYATHSKFCSSKCKCRYARRLVKYKAWILSEQLKFNQQSATQYENRAA